MGRGSAPRRKAPEHRLQCAIVDLHRLHVPLDRGLLFAIPNSLIRSPAQLAWMRDEGFADGAPDLALVLGEGRVVWIEVKTEASKAFGVGAGRLSEEQRAFRGRLEAMGHRYVVVRSVDAYADLLVELGLRRPGPILAARPNTPPFADAPKPRAARPSRPAAQADGAWRWKPPARGR